MDAVTPREAEAIAAIDADCLVSLLAELVAIPSVTGSAEEGRVQHRLADWMAEHGLEVDLWPIDLDALRADPDFPGLVRDAHRDLTGSEPDLHGAPYGSDLRLLTNLGGIPTLQYGPGDVRHAHAPDEHVAIADLISAARTLTLVILRFCGVR